MRIRIKFTTRCQNYEEFFEVKKTKKWLKSKKTKNNELVQIYYKFVNKHCNNYQIPYIFSSSIFSF